jgi:hypothetical protein
MKHGRLLVLVIIFLALQLIILTRAQAEYRVYKLGVKLADKAPEQEVLTTLDDLQYSTYFNTSPTQQVRLIQHWMCRGRTDDFKKYCPGPIAKVNPVTPPNARLGVRAPAANNLPAQGPVPVTNP